MESMMPRSRKGVNVTSAQVPGESGQSEAPYLQIGYGKKKR